MSQKLCSPLASDPNCPREAQRRQLAENLGSLLACEWLRRRSDGHPVPANPPPLNRAFEEETTAAAGQTHKVAPPAAE